MDKRHKLISFDLK